MAFSYPLAADVLRTACERRGPANAPVVLLQHGFPDDARTQDGMLEPPLAAGYQTLAPSRHGCGNSVFLDAATPARARPRPGPRAPSRCSVTSTANTRLRCTRLSPPRRAR